MKRPSRIFPVAALVLLTACSGGVNELLAIKTGPQKTIDVTQLPSMRVVGMSVTVPETLSVSEANSYNPVADIVWREDPFGNRYQQVKLIMENAIRQGSSQMQGNLPIVLHVEVTRFHALTLRTRYSIGGEHEIDFLLTVTNGRTGDVVIPTYLISTSFAAFGGRQALAAERLGLTQKVRITEHISALIQQELTGVAASGLASQPGGPTLEFGDQLGNELTGFIEETK